MVISNKGSGAVALRFYLDENLPVEIARQLKAWGIDAITVRDLRRLGDVDENHLQRAAAGGRVLCTFDTDFIDLAARGIPHAGIVLGQPEIHSIGAGSTILNSCTRYCRWRRCATGLNTCDMRRWVETHSWYSKCVQTHWGRTAPECV